MKIEIEISDPYRSYHLDGNEWKDVSMTLTVGDFKEKLIYNRANALARYLDAQTLDYKAAMEMVRNYLLPYLDSEITDKPVKNSHNDKQNLA